MNLTLGLVADDVLQIVVEEPLRPLIQRWLPRGLVQPASAARVTIVVFHGAPSSNLPNLLQPPQPPTLALGRVAAWVDDGRRMVLLRGRSPASAGVVSLGIGRARLGVDPAEAPAAADDLYSMLTLSAALLLAGLGRALVHAGAIVTPEGEAWLLVGDARSGKSTTCATLAAAGWGFLSDDQVVLAPRDDGVEVEGWLRPFHLDRDGARREVPPEQIGLARWRRTAPLAGVILPAVVADEPTILTSLRASDALAGLVRQSPWLLARRDTAPRVLELLERVVEGSSFRLQLGRDTYREPERLSACVGPLAAHARAC